MAKACYHQVRLVFPRWFCRRECFEDRGPITKDVTTMAIEPIYTLFNKLSTNKRKKYIEESVQERWVVNLVGNVRSWSDARILSLLNSNSKLTRSLNIIEGNWKKHGLHHHMLTLILSLIPEAQLRNHMKLTGNTGNLEINETIYLCIYWINKLRLTQGLCMELFVIDV